MLNELTRKLLDIVLPPICFECKREGFYICPECSKTLQQFNYFICPICKRRDPDGILDRSCQKKSTLNRFLGAPLPYYKDAVKRIIHSLKYAYVKDLAIPLSEILIEFLAKNNFPRLIENRNDKIILIPVPMYEFRKRERGFNQSEEIAKYVSTFYGLPLEKNVLIKTKNTEPQAEIENYEDRAQNIAGVFACKNTDKLIGKITILIDDVYTSGSTMQECARVLKKSGAREVWGITVAKS